MRSRTYLPFVVVTMCALLSLALVRHALASNEAVGTHTTFLPLVQRIQRGPAPQPTTSPTPTPPDTDPSGALFLEPGQKAASPGIGVDAQGGMHVAYHYYMNSDGPHMVYAFCPPPATQCGAASNWPHVTLEPTVDDVQLALTPDGKPRLLGTRSSVGRFGGLFLSYIYAECDANCLEAANWRTAEVTTARAGLLLDPRELPRRFFALDHAGHPRFVFDDSGTDMSDGSYRRGGYLAGCDADCAVADNWTAARFTHPDPDSPYRGESVGSPILTFTSANQPRILGTFFPASSDFGYVAPVMYFACDSGCDDDANWNRAAITPRGNGPEPAWDLKLDPGDHPRVVVYHEETDDNATQRLAYYQCDTRCTDEGAWQPVVFDLDQTVGKSANLELDAAGNPRIAYLANHGALGYSWCNGGCTQKSNWQHGTAETTEDLDATNPVAIPPSCAPGVWSNYGVSFTLDPQGNPRIAYDATYYANCLNLPRPGLPPTSGFQEIDHRVRVYFTVQP